MTNKYEFQNMIPQNSVLKLYINKVRKSETVIAPFLTVIPIDLCELRGQIEYKFLYNKKK